MKTELDESPLDACQLKRLFQAGGTSDYQLETRIFDNQGPSSVSVRRKLFYIPRSWMKGLRVLKVQNL